MREPAETRDLPIFSSGIYHLCDCGSERLLIIFSIDELSR